MMDEERLEKGHRQLIQTYYKVRTEALTSGGEYWQGKKDGIRTALVLLSPTEEEGKHGNC